MQNYWTSPVVQWLGICLPMQGTQIQSLLQEDYTCGWATNPMCHNYWPALQSLWDTLLKPSHLEPCSVTREVTIKRSLHAARKSSHCSWQPEKAHTQQWRPITAKKKKVLNNKKFKNYLPSYNNQNSVVLVEG